MPRHKTPFENTNFIYFSSLESLDFSGTNTLRAFHSTIKTSSVINSFTYVALADYVKLERKNQLIPFANFAIISFSFATSTSFTDVA